MGATVVLNNVGFKHMNIIKQIPSRWPPKAANNESRLLLRLEVLFCSIELQYECHFFFEVALFRYLYGGSDGTRPSSPVRQDGERRTTFLAEYAFRRVLFSRFGSFYFLL